MHFSGFRRIENLEPYTALRGLWLDSNGITTIEGVSHLSELRCLFLQQNAISRISGLDGLSRLQTLNLSGNSITFIEGLSSLTALTSLVLSKNSLASADAIAHLTECAALASVDLTNNELEGDEENTVLSTLSRMPALVNLKLTGNGLCRTTRHYRKTVIVSMPRIAYLDERPVFAPERAATEAWARGGADAERAERSAQEARSRSALTEQAARFTAWAEEVRLKRARELDALNATRIEAGEAPLSALPARVHVSYTRASARHMTESAALKRITEAAEKAYGPGGNGILFEDTDGVVSTATGDRGGGDEALSSSDASGSEDGGDGGRDGGGSGDATENILLSNGLETMGSEDTEAAVEADMLAQICRAENEKREVERRARSALDAAVAEKLHAGEAARAALIAESMRLFNASNVMVSATASAADLADETEEDDDAADFSAVRRAQKYAEWGATATSFFDRRGAAGDNAAVPPTSTASAPEAAAVAAPTVTELSLNAATAACPENDIMWFQSLDNALVKLTSQAAFDFEKVARGVQAAGADETPRRQQVFFLK